MIVFRSTKRLIARLHLAVTAEPPASTGTLGDWYANTLNVGRARYVLCLSERTLLPVIVSARKTEFLEGFPEALARVLHGIGIASAHVERERSAATQALVAPTRSRVLLGALNDFAWNAEAHFRHDPGPTRPSPLDVALRLAKMPSKPIGYSSPDRVTREILAAAPS
jgi:hypothetical protein